MAHSSLLGIDEVPGTPPGHDTEALGPSDTSDSGSDVAGLADLDDGDPGLPVDFAIDVDNAHPATSFEAIGGGSDSDSAGTGERRSAGGDAGLREGADISPDRVVFDPNTGEPADGVLDDVFDDSPRPEGGVDAPLYASAFEASSVDAHLDELAQEVDEDDEDDADGLRRRAAAIPAGGGDDENEEVEPPLPGGTHPKAQGPAKPHGHHPSRRERDHGLGGPEPDVPEPTPPPVNDPSDEGVNDEGDDVVVVPNR
jgi:hypothetical protein